MPTKAELQSAFRTFDISGDGKISADEMVAILTRRGGRNPMSTLDAKSLIADFDTNGDGVLDLDEFCELMSSNQAVAMGGMHVPGVGTAFEFLDEHSQWRLITDKYVIDQLGKLCAYNKTTEVFYNAAGHNRYRCTQKRDGSLEQTNCGTGVARDVRLVPFFFEFEEAPNDWRPVTAPEALTALTAVLASSLPKTYEAKSATDGRTNPYEAKLLNGQGLIQQRNTYTQRLRRVRVTPVGPDGQPHYEFREGGVGSGRWDPVAQSCVKMLAAVAAGRGARSANACHATGHAMGHVPVFASRSAPRVCALHACALHACPRSCARATSTRAVAGDAYYTINYPEGHSFHYHARLDADGHLIQRNTKTGAERPLRPAPWLGHGVAAGPPERRADPTEGYVPSRGIDEHFGRRQGRVGAAAADFYVPEEVPLGEAEAPVVLQEAVPIGPPPDMTTHTTMTTTHVYYYMPQVMNAWDMQSAVPMATPVQSDVPMATPV